MKWTADQVAYKLATDDKWLELAIVRLHERQTELEKQTKSTYIKNDVGLQVADARDFSLFAKQIKTEKSGRRRDRQLS